MPRSAIGSHPTMYKVGSPDPVKKSGVTWGSVSECEFTPLTPFMGPFIGAPKTPIYNDRFGAHLVCVVSCEQLEKVERKPPLRTTPWLQVTLLEQLAISWTEEMVQLHSQELGSSSTLGRYQKRDVPQIWMVSN